jgi:hypothetical protein
MSRKQPTIASAKLTGVTVIGPDDPDDEEETNQQQLDLPITPKTSGFSGHICSVLHREGATTFRKLLEMPAYDVNRIKGIGPTSRRQISACLEKRGLQLGQEYERKSQEKREERDRKHDLHYESVGGGNSFRKDVVAAVRAVQAREPELQDIGLRDLIWWLQLYHEALTRSFLLRKGKHDERTPGPSPGARQRMLMEMLKLIDLQDKTPWADHTYDQGCPM